jgi:hypothetical protein
MAKKGKKAKGPSKAERQEMENRRKIYRAKCRLLEQEVEEENRNTNLYSQERERVNYVWMTQKRKNEELQAELLDRQKEREDLEAKNRIEEKLYYQKIKYIMLKQQDENVELQKDMEIALKQFEDMHRIKEKDYKYDVRALSKMKKEQEVLQNDFINALQKDNIKDIHELKMDYELKECQIRGFYREKMKEMRNNATEQRNKTIEEITNKKTREIKKLTDNHANDFNKMKNYYGDLNNKNLNKLKSLADDLKKAIDLQNNLKNQKNKRISQKRKIEEPYKKLIEENKMLLEKEKKCLENFNLLRNQNIEYNKLIKQLLDAEYKYEVTFQKVTYLDKEHNHFLDKFKSNLHRVEQESVLKNFILEKKLEILEDNLEIKEVQLKELIKKTMIDPAKINELTSTLEEVDLMKSETINQLEEELRRIKETHANMIKTYEAKLAEFGIPVEEMGFEPLLPVNEVKTVNNNMIQQMNVSRQNGNNNNHTNSNVNNISLNINNIGAH